MRRRPLSAIVLMEPRRNARFAPRDFAIERDRMYKFVVPNGALMDGCELAPLELPIILDGIFLYQSAT